MEGNHKPRKDPARSRLEWAPPSKSRADVGGTTVVLPDAASSRLPSNVPRYLGAYELLEELGRGGMGIVFRARHLRLGTRVAVKVMIAGEHASPDAIRRFQREASAVARLGKHPHIITVHHLGQEGSLAYYAMDLVEGEPLSMRLQRGRVPVDQATVLVEKVARALHFAHQHGVVHRDVKPDNILVREDGEPQITDFGLVYTGGDTRLTSARTLIGTPCYMAPERARGDAEAGDRRVDVYGLGVVLYEMLTGAPPHDGASPQEVLDLVQRGEIVPPRVLNPSVPVPLEAIVLKALASDPARRYATAQALANELARWRRGEPVIARPVGRLARWLRRWRRPVRLSAWVVLLELGTLFLSAALLWGHVRM